MPRSASGTAVTAEAKHNKRSTASEAVLRAVDKYAFPSAMRWGGGGATATTDGSSAVAADAETDVGADQDPDPAAASPLPSASPASAQLPLTAAVVPTSPASAAAILSRASFLAEALCVWKYFGLPVAALEASLRPRLGEGDSVRVLTAVFFPQLSRDGSSSSARSGAAPGRDHPPPTRPAGERGVVDGGGGETLMRNSTDLDNLGFSPRFFLALTRAAAAAKLPRLASTAAVAGGGGTGVLRPSASSSHPSDRRSGNASNNNNNRRTSGVRSATMLGPSPLTLLLEHRAGGGAALASSSSSSLVRLAPPALIAAAPSSSLSATVGRSGGRYDSAVATSAWPSGAEGSSLSGSRSAAAAAAAAGGRKHIEDANVVWCFSCGHRFSRDHLLNTVVPESASSVRQATASLERTQQVLALEYEGRHDNYSASAAGGGGGGAGTGAAGAACPECAAKELVRLAAVAGASMQPRGTFAEAGNAVPARSPPPPPPVPSQRLQTQGRPRVR